MAHPSVTEQSSTQRSSDRSGERSDSAFRTISDVSHELGVAQHVLRFWETKFNQIRPMKRAGGRRYYRPEDFALLKRIHHLLYTEGYTIPGAQKALKGVTKTRLRNEELGNAPSSTKQPLASLANGALQAANSDYADPVYEAQAAAAAAIIEPPPARETVVEYRLTPKQTQLLHATLAELMEMKALLPEDGK